MSEMPRCDDGDPVLRLVLRGELVAAGPSVEIQNLTGDAAGDTDQMQPLRPAWEKTLGFLCVDAAGGLTYEARVESEEGRIAAEAILRHAAMEYQAFPGLSQAAHAIRFSQSTGNLMRNPMWQHCELGPL